LVDTIQDPYCAEFGKSATAAVLTHCKRDLMHAIWTLLLDTELMHAYVHGIVMECIDGILQCFFPRFFIYSADYPEKVLLACIKYLGNMPCPQCLICKADVPMVGSKYDQRKREMHQQKDDTTWRKDGELAQKWFYKNGMAVTSVHTDGLLGPKSLVPTRVGINFFNSM
ncbi:hypothetical protein L208DRAFT_1282850, partial [Tricholoma matsutake]